MGRVRRYKKFKACDPFSKRKKTEVDTVHDEPPSIFEEREMKVAKKAEKLLMGGMSDKFLQREAMRELKISAAMSSKSEKKVESKREDESMKAFRERIKKSTMKTLREELRSKTATVQKKKAYLKEKKAKSKASKSPSTAGEDILDFSISEDGHRSKAEIEGVTTFFQPETVRFGERVERPPDLAALAAKFTAKKRPNSASSSSSLSSFASSAIGTGGGNSQVSTADELAALREKVQAAYSQLRQRRIDQKLR